MLPIDQKLSEKNGNTLKDVYVTISSAFINKNGVFGVNFSQKNGNPAHAFGTNKGRP